MTSERITIYSDLWLRTDEATNSYNKYRKLFKEGVETASKDFDAVWSSKKGKFEYQIEVKADRDAKVEMVDPKAKSELGKIVKKQDEILGKNKDTLTSLRQQVNTHKQLRDGLPKYVTEIGKGNKAIRVLNAEWVSQNKKVDEASYKVAKLHGNFMQMAKIKFPWINQLMTLGNAFNQISMIIQSVIVVIQALSGAIGTLVQRQKQIQGLKLSFEGFGLTAEQANQILHRSKIISLTYGASLSGVEKAFKRVTPAIVLAGGSLEDVSMVVESLAARTATLGLNTEQTGRYIEAFAQVMGKGRLQSEELNQQFSELDGALRGQISGYLKSKHGIEDLDEAMKNGQVGAGLFMEAFTAISEEMRDNLKGELKQVQQRIDELNVQQIDNIVQTLNTISLESLGKTFGGFGESLNRVRVGFSQFISSMVTSFETLNGVVKFLMDALGLLVEFIVNGLFVGIKAAFMGLEGMAKMLAVVIQKFAELPVVKDVFAGIATFAKDFLKSFRIGTDYFLGWGDAIDKNASKLSEINGELLVLQNKQAKGIELTEEEKQRMAELEAQARKTAAAMAAAFGEDVAKLLGARIEDLQKELAQLQPVADALGRTYQRQADILRAMQSAHQKKTDAEIAGLEQVKAKLEEALDTEERRHKRAKQAIEDKYDTESRRLDEVNSKKMAGLQMELDALGGKTPAEEKLAKLRKQELQAKLGSANLSRKERLEVEAQLERMERQEQIAQKQKQIAAEREQQEKDKEALQKRQNTALDAENKKHDSIKQSLENQLEVIDGKIVKITDKQDAYNKKVDETLEKIDLQQKGLDKLPTSLDEQIRKTQEVADAYQPVIEQVTTIQNKIDSLIIKMGKLLSQIKQAKSDSEEIEAPKSKGKEEPKSPGTTGAAGGAAGGAGFFRFAGGPVTGGTPYTVNEFGQEGFLSASGRLSEINAPSWGTWRAPGSGTVIPAHIWSEMNASGAAAAASGAAAVASNVNASGGMARALKGLMGGSNDRITNNVTIQAANTVQAASDMMVQLNRIRRRRMG